MVSLNKWPGGRADCCTLVVWQMSVKSQPIWKVEETPLSQDAFYAQSSVSKSLEDVQYGISQSLVFFGVRRLSI